MVGTVKSVGFSFDGSFVVGGSDEGGVLEVAHVESGECVGKVDTGGGAGVVSWHPGRYVRHFSELFFSDRCHFWSCKIDLWSRILGVRPNLSLSRVLLLLFPLLTKQC